MILPNGPIAYFIDVACFVFLLLVLRFVPKVNHFFLLRMVRADKKVRAISYVDDSAAWHKARTAYTFRNLGAFLGMFLFGLIPVIIVVRIAAIPNVHSIFLLTCATIQMIVVLLFALSLKLYPYPQVLFQKLLSISSKPR